MSKKVCPKCASSNIEIVDYLGTKCLVCRACGYDECALLEVYPEQKVSQKAKGSYSPYKTGGAKRTLK